MVPKRNSFLPGSFVLWVGCFVALAGILGYALLVAAAAPDDARYTTRARPWFGPRSRRGA